MNQLKLTVLIYILSVSSAIAQSAGDIDMTFNSGYGPDHHIHSISVQSDGKIIIAGYFEHYDDIVRKKIARLYSNGHLDYSFNPGTGVTGGYDLIMTTAIQQDGKILIGGYFTAYNGTPVNSIARLNTNGSLDTTFHTGSGFDIQTNSIVIQPDGKILVGGYFHTYDGFNSPGIIRLMPDGMRDTTFHTGSGLAIGTNQGVHQVSLFNDGRIAIGGTFDSYDGVISRHVAVLNADGSIDTNFSAGNKVSGGNITTCVATNDGKVIIGGPFTSYGGTARHGIAKLNEDGFVDTTFNPGYGLNPSAPAPFNIHQVENLFLITGGFSSYNGATSHGIVRVYSDGSVDNGFSTGSGANAIVYCSTIQPDGKILLGGAFTSFNGESAMRIVRLNNDINYANVQTSETNADGLNFYPNPVQESGKLTVSKATWWSLYAPTGKLIKTGTSIDEFNGLTWSLLPTGTYIVRVLFNDRVCSLKIIHE